MRKQRLLFLTVILLAISIISCSGGDLPDNAFSSSSQAASSGSTASSSSDGSQSSSGSLSSSSSSSSASWGPGATYTEPFHNFNESGSGYENGSFSGSAGMGVTWTYVECRGDLYITGTSICLARESADNGYFYSSTIPDGCYSIRFKYQKAFSTDVNLQVQVNGTPVGNFTASDSAVHDSGEISVTVTGGFSIKFLQNSGGGQVIIDDLQWTSYVGGGSSASSSSSGSSSSTSTSSSSTGTSFNPDPGDPHYSYYQSAAGLSGAALKSQLQVIISSGHSVQSYSGLWTCYDESDMTPGGKIWDMYSSTSADGSSAAYWFSYSSDQCGSYGGESDCYNREHSWPKSWFGDSSPMYSDLVQVVPTDGYVNNRRDNHPFGEVGSTTWTSDNGSKLGSARSGLGYSGTVFEPIDTYKGDFARIYFYMATRYGGNGAGQSVPMSSGNFVLDSWAENMLRTWHANDPVSQKERDRNNVIDTKQYNRNPFVDYPELVDLITDF